MEPLVPRLVRPVPRPPGLYFSPNYTSHTALTELLASGAPRGLQGVVFDASLDHRQEELLQEVLNFHVEAVLDPKAMELATETGFARMGDRKLPWAGDLPDTLERYQSAAVRQATVHRIVERVAKRRFDAVLAPTHFLLSSSEPWLSLDREMTFRLRDVLDQAGLTAVRIYYPLALSSKTFGDSDERQVLRLALSTLPIDAIWLRVSPFGNQSGATSVCRYIRGCQDLHQERPLVAQSVGAEGLALLAFGAVGGIGSGIASGEYFDIRPLLRPQHPLTRRFGPKRRIYITELQAFLAEDKAAHFFEVRGMKALFACKDEGCCRLGVEDMLRDPRRHYMKQRLAEVRWLGGIPELIRPNRYLEEILRRTTDRMIRAAKVEPSLRKTQLRLESLRIALGALYEKDIPSWSTVAQGRRIEVRKGA